MSAMCRKVCALAVAGTLLLAPSSRANNARDDASRIEGVWQIVALDTVNGRVEGDSIKGTLEIRGKKAHIKVQVADREDVDNRYEFDLHPLAEPPAFDVRWPDGRITRGIYRFVGDTWVRCHGSPNGPRPVNFENAAAQGNVLTVWRKAKRPPPEPEAPPDQVAQ